MKPLQAILNGDNRKIAQYNPNTGAIEIKLKNCLTYIWILPGGGIKVENQKPEK